MKKFIIRDENIRLRAIDYLMKVKIDKPLEITIEPEKKNKTGEQRAWFHMLCRLLGAATGYTQGEIKDLAKSELWGTTRVVIGSKAADSIKSSEDADREEYSQLIECVYRLGAEAGIPLPPPHFVDHSTKTTRVNAVMKCRICGKPITKVDYTVVKRWDTQTRRPIFYHAPCWDKEVSERLRREDEAWDKKCGAMR